jgi:hypothetical protein
MTQQSKAQIDTRALSNDMSLQMTTIAIALGGKLTEDQEVRDAFAKASTMVAVLIQLAQGTPPSKFKAACDRVAMLSRVLGSELS